MRYNIDNGDPKDYAYNHDSRSLDRKPVVGTV